MLLAYASSLPSTIAASAVDAAYCCSLQLVVLLLLLLLLLLGALTSVMSLADSGTWASDRSCFSKSGSSELLNPGVA
jgi:hypothetical protein